MSIARSCPVCGKALKGRADKRFCSQACRNAHHGAQRRLTRDAVREIDAILHRNHRVLAEIFADERSKKLMVPRLRLEHAGFNFNYHTGIYRNAQGKFYHYVYDYAWMEFSTQEVMLIKKNQRGGDALPQ